MLSTERIAYNTSISCQEVAIYIFDVIISLNYVPSPSVCPDNNDYAAGLAYHYTQIFVFTRSDACGTYDSSQYCPDAWS